MKRFLFGSEIHDEACRVILRDDSMGKSIRLSFQREPSFFPAEQIGNTWSQFVLLYDDETDTVLGFGSRSGRPYWLHGEEVELGYISQLRLVPQFRNRRYLGLGYRKFKELHADGRVPFYLTTILKENVTARAVLEANRRGMPAYLPIGELSSFFSLAQRKKVTSDVDASFPPVMEVCAIYNAYAQQQCLATRYDRSALGWLSLVSVRPVMLRGHNFVASTILTDFSAVKQIVVKGYSAAYRCITGLARLGSVPFGFVAPPKAGETLKCLYLVATSVQGDEDAGFHALMQYARGVAYREGYHGVICGVASQSRFAQPLRRMSISNTESILYAVGWDVSSIPTIGGEGDAVSVEVATL